MNFSIYDMMRNAFVITTNKNEYSIFEKRFIDSGFRNIPMNADIEMPKCLCGLEQCGIKPTSNKAKIRRLNRNHFIIVKMAKTIGFDHVTIFESDAFPMKDCYSRLGDFLSSGGVPDDSDEITFGNMHWIRDWTNGGTHDHSLSDVDEQCRFGRINGELWGAHSVVIFSKAYDKWMNSYLRMSDSNFRGVDWYNTLVDTCYATTRSFFIQARETLCWQDKMLDKQWLSDFPEIK